MDRRRSVNLAEFERLLAEQNVDFEVPSKVAFQEFKKLESQRARNQMDSTPETVLQILRRKTSAGLLKKKNSSIVPPPPIVALNNHEHQHIDKGKEVEPGLLTPSFQRSASEARIKFQAPGILQKRHTFSTSPLRKPPPPDGPPPGYAIIPPSKSPKNLARGSSERELFLLREKVNALENSLAKETQEKERLKNILVQTQRDLHVSETNLKETEAALKGLRDRFSSNDKQQSDLREKIKALQLEQKSFSRKSRQRFDAAIDFMKGMLVESRFENLLQIIKSRLRMIVGAEKTEIYMVDHEEEELVAYRERSSSKLWTARFPIDAGIVGAVIQEKTMQIVQDVESDTRFDALVDGIGSNGVRTLVIYPILMKREVAAMVVVANKLSLNGRVTGEQFSTQDIHAIQDLASLTTLVLIQKERKEIRD